MAGLKKRWIAAACILAALLFALGGRLLHQCRTAVSFDRLADFLLASPVYCEGMQPLEKEELVRRYPGIRAEDIISFRAFAARDATAREFALLEAAGEREADAVCRALSLFCSEREKLFELADPQEAARVRAYHIRRTRNYVLFTISDPEGNGRRWIEDFLTQSGYDRSR
ncbi:MAG: DUF4358 domain-containing protein [Provencibacterium sp.]|jgi:hypothetical protein|nr:DUF4358 domain-containing protein [Provencibacterium sp.]